MFGAEARPARVKRREGRRRHPHKRSGASNLSRSRHDTASGNSNLRRPQRWTITLCLIHALLRNRGCVSSCEADLGSLLAMRLLMSVAGKSCHQGNSDPKGPATFRINHSSPSMKMNGYGQPDLPYQLGRFVTQGWGTKAVLDFMNNAEKTVTVARVNPDATKLLVLRGKLTGSSGWTKTRSVAPSRR